MREVRERLIPALSRAVERRERRRLARRDRQHSAREIRDAVLGLPSPACREARSFDRRGR
jgi:hypothetical protein